MASIVGTGQSEARSLLWVFYMGAGVQSLGPSSQAISRELEIKHSGLEPAPMWDAGTPGRGLICSATVLALYFILKMEPEDISP